MSVCNTREKTIPWTSTKIYKLGQYNDAQKVLLKILYRVPYNIVLTAYL